MEFPFDVNHVLPFEVTILNGDYRVLNPGQPVRILAPEKLTCIIDAIGEASYKAQGLHGAVTTARKLRTSEHHLYIIKDANDHNNRGSVIGLLKVGRKHLYLYDTNGQVYERTPLCVLDFYVHESRQRLGYGRKLFGTMLNFEKCAPYELPVDRPSSKCLGFLHKHYNLSSPIHQVNNYVVYQAFFNQSSDTTDPKSSNAKQHDERTSWLVPSHRQPTKLASEPSGTQQHQRRAANIDENHLFDNRRQMSRTSVSPVRVDRQPVSYYSTSYGRHYNQNPVLPGSPEKTQSARYTPRSYAQVFPPHNSNQFQPRDSTSQYPAMNNYRRTIEFAPNFSSKHPSLTKPTPNSLPPHPTTHLPPPSSSTWRIFGIPQLLN